MRSTTVLIFAASLVLSAAERKVVVVDGWHNNEKQPHYRWDGTYMGGFSQLGDLLKGNGAELKTLTEAASAKSLQGIDCLIAVDPDTPAETEKPQYWSAPEIDAVEKWVRDGGRLLLLGNDKGNAEFEHFNHLAARFGIEFIEGKHATPAGVTKLKLKGGKAPVFTDGLEFYAVDVAPLKLTNKKAEVLLAEGDTPIMAVVPHGKGFVFALGDPWLYNEYINSSNNRQIGENLFRYLLGSKR
jgi:unsaturated rhamnogalacturonyl hydrolase